MENGIIFENKEEEDWKQKGRWDQLKEKESK